MFGRLARLVPVGGRFAEGRTARAEASTDDDACAAVPAGGRAAGNYIWDGHWHDYLFPGMWLIYLTSTIASVHKHSHGVAAIIGYAIVPVFAALYLIGLPAGWRRRRRLYLICLGSTIGLTVVEAFLAQDGALAFAVYIGVLAVASRARWGAAIVVAAVASVLLLPWLIPSWGGKPDVATAFVLALISLAMHGFFMVIESNLALDAARAEVARLAAENERSRIARDLHDLLGHSLTTITVKAGLARRLSERDDPRAKDEIAEVEQVARRTLADVRAAVAGHRELTLAGEIATAREVLRAAGIEAELPGSVDVVDPRFNELFAWVLREGITNTVKHSRGRHCRVELTVDSITIADDGRVTTDLGKGSGLLGLRERVEAEGGVLSVDRENGWALVVRVPDAAVSADGRARDQVADGPRTAVETPS